VAIQYLLPSMSSTQPQGPGSPNPDPDRLRATEPWTLKRIKSSSSWRDKASPPSSSASSNHHWMSEMRSFISFAFLWLVLEWTLPHILTIVCLILLMLFEDFPAGIIVFFFTFCKSSLHRKAINLLPYLSQLIFPICHLSFNFFVANF
jgi:hypothetical protein